MSKKAEKNARARAVKSVRSAERRQLMQKAKDVCEQLGVSSYTHYGDSLYKKVLENASYTEIPGLVRMFKDNPLVAAARRESLPESDPAINRIFDLYLGDHDAPRKRPTDQSMWDVAQESMTPVPSKGLKFGSSLPIATPTPVVEVVAPVVVPAPKADEPELRNQFADSDPAPASSGFIVAGQKRLSQTNRSRGWRTSSAPGSPVA